MKTVSIFLCPASSLVGAAISAAMLLTTSTALFSQGTVTFDARPYFSGTNYVELGMQFRTVIPPGSTRYDNMVIVPPGVGNVPQDSTPFIGWFRQYNPYNYVCLSLTDGSLFGLTSVWLADPIFPSPSPVSISFVGFLADGSTVINTFTTRTVGGGGFDEYTFGPAFNSGLTRVDILAPRWAMDNLVWVPEPGTWALLAVGVGMLSCVWFRSSKKQHR
jgi:hypothetical protein